MFNGSLMTKICKETRSKVTGVSFLFQLTVFSGSVGYSYAVAAPAMMRNDQTRALDPPTDTHAHYIQAARHAQD